VTNKVARQAAGRNTCYRPVRMEKIRHAHTSQNLVPDGGNWTMAAAVSGKLRPSQARTEQRLADQVADPCHCCEIYFACRRTRRNVAVARRTHAAQPGAVRMARKYQGMGHCENILAARVPVNPVSCQGSVVVAPSHRSKLPGKTQQAAPTCRPATASRRIRWSRTQWQTTPTVPNPKQESKPVPVFAR